MNFIIEIIIESIIRAITYAIVVSVTKSIHTSIKKSVSKKLLKNLEQFIGANGEPDEEKISSLIKVNVQPMELGQYHVTIDESIFDVLHMSVVTTKDTTHLIKQIKQEIKIQKIKAKFTNNIERVSIIEMLEEGFK